MRVLDKKKLLSMIDFTDDMLDTFFVTTKRKNKKEVMKI